MRRGRWVLAGVIALGLAGAAVWWAQRGLSHRTPPDVAISDPVLAAAVAKARAEVLARPADAGAWGRLGQTFLANGLVVPAGECLAEAGRLDPRDPRWPYLEAVSLLLRDPVAALPCWQRAAECPGDDDRAVTARLRWAEALLANDRPAEAEGVLRGVLARHPDNPRVHLDLGLLAVARGDPAAGVEHFRRCADHPSARKTAAVHLAALYTAQGKTAEAAEFVRRAEELPPDYDWPDPFLEANIPFTVGRESLFIQAERQQQTNPRQAILLFQEVIQHYPDEARAYAKLGMLLVELGDYPAAENVLRSGLAVNPDLVQSHFFLAAALLPQAERLGADSDAGREKFRQVAAAARRATELKPDHGFAHLYLGLALKNLGQKREALTALREAVRCTPDATDPHLHLGQALWDEGQTEQALAELETAVRLAAPTDTRPRAALERVKAAKPEQKK